MREFELTVELPVPPPLLLRLLFDDAGAFFCQYHSEVSRDTAATVTPWAPLKAEQDGPQGQPRPLATRAVRFVKRMDLPSAVTSLLGACRLCTGQCQPVLGAESWCPRRRRQHASCGRCATTVEPAQRRRLRGAQLGAGGADEGAPAAGLLFEMFTCAHHGCLPGDGPILHAGRHLAGGCAHRQPAAPEVPRGGCHLRRARCGLLACHNQPPWHSCHTSQA